MKELSYAYRGLAATIALGAMLVPSFAQEDKPFSPQHRGVPVLLIERVEQLVNLDHGDALGKNRADFYAIVTVNGRSHKTEVYSKDDAYPYWEIPLDMKSRYSNITVRIMEEDGGLEAKDDHADISPIQSYKDMRLKYDRHTGRVSGAVRGRLNQRFIQEGKGDDDRARITFKIYKG